ncbi:hypothetical protein C0Q44_03390 [Paenibacillus sp. PCH8]|uniref:hypothetical protein n=1 Tax=Paenibacillus sp. PCH8 TaxID=2066524 RepID=UPI000CF9A91C|nr:hypothetical protein [Paenibacillus sp. PCH8]PQP83744.1 hypothetical protein C0Q44_03390 [Paenibacillus sp. PCH8]
MMEQMTDMKSQENEVLELVMFRLKADTDPKQFIAAAGILEQLLANQIPGFVRRSLLCTEDGTSWTDLISWKDMQSAVSALKQLPATVEFKNFASMIDPQDMVMRHLIPAQKWGTES